MNKYNSYLINDIDIYRKRMEDVCEELRLRIQQIVDYNGGVIYLDNVSDSAFGYALKGDEVVEQVLLCLRLKTYQSGKKVIWGYFAPIGYENGVTHDFLDKTWEEGWEETEDYTDCSNLDEGWFEISHWGEIAYPQTILQIAEHLSYYHTIYYKENE